MEGEEKKVDGTLKKVVDEQFPSDDSKSDPNDPETIAHEKEKLKKKHMENAKGFADEFE